MSTSPEPYEIYAVKYAYRDAVRANNFIFSDAHDVPLPLDSYVWAIGGKS